MMYILFIAIAAVIGICLVAQGIRRGRARRAAAGITLLVATVLLLALMSFWGEMLWFEHVGYAGRFWTAVLATAGVAGAGAAASGLAVALLTLPVRERLGASWRWPVIAGAVLGGAWGIWSWDVLLLCLNGVTTGTHEPIFGRDTGFYLFTLPFLDRLYGLLLALAVVSACTAFAANVLPEHGGSLAARRSWASRLDPRDLEPAASPAAPPVDPSLSSSDGVTFTTSPPEAETPPPPEGEERGPAPDGTALVRPVLLALGAVALVLAAGRYIDALHLLYSRWGIVYGPGWTDVHIRLPGYYILAVLLAVTGGVLFAAGASPRLSARLLARLDAGGARLLRSLFALAGAVAAVWILALLGVPLLFQWLRVAPSEITVERPYLAHNIAFTRRGFDLEKVEERAFAPAGGLTPEVVAENQHLLSEVRLWDPQALESVLGQFQEIRLYYEMSDVDIDRYVLGDRYRQVMLAAREMEHDNLPRESQTFVNKHFKYTHGYGLAMASVFDFTPDGLPNLLVKNIPPVADHPELRLDRPEIYYGQRTRGYVVANTKEPEFNYPLGKDNVYSRYEGSGGVELSSFWRKLVYGWKLGGTRLLFSTYPTGSSRILYHRDILERVATLAPFLDFDHDPYITLVDGRLQWIIDAYTTSSYYPYSEPYFSGEIVEPADRDQAAGDRRRAGAGDVIRANVAHYLHGKNYVRNSVKAVVDAYDGTVTFYVFDPDDPIVQAWGRIFPGLFRSKVEMPPALRAHVRYPEGFLLAQGLVYAKYHMTDPDVFYNQEDLWIRATEKYYDQVRSVDPYYVMWKLPEAARPEFALIQPFTPKNRQVLIGWIAGLCDPESYGRLIAYRFPKDKWVLGTQQVDTKIDQDPFLSAQLALWDQRGSRVIRGNVLVIPINETLLYVEPIYLQAEKAAYPELRVVVVMHEDQMRYADTFEEALRALVTGAPRGARAGGLAPFLDGKAPEAARRASDALESYLRLLGERRFEEAAAQLRALETALQELTAAPPLPGLPP